MTTPPPSPSPPRAVLAEAAGILASRFRYEAQSNDGRRVTGVIDATDAEAAARQLEMLRMRLVRLDPIEPPGSAEAVAAMGAIGADGVNAEAPAGAAVGGSGGAKSSGRARGRALRGDDFIAFNQQLAHLAKAGLPIESGLRLIARDMQRGRLAETVRQVADELDRGTPIGEAFDKHRARFPSLYGRLLDAGVRGGDLPGVLLNLGRHLEMVQRLRSTLWRVLSYPLMVLTALALVLTFLGIYVLPQFREMYEGFGHTTTYSFRTGQNVPLLAPTLPWPTLVLFEVSKFVPFAAAVGVALLVLAPIAWGVLRLRGWDRHVADSVALRLPLIGRPLRLNLVARWCDALRIGVSAGLPLPDAVGLASDAVRSPRLRRDGQALVALLEGGRPLTDANGAGGAADARSSPRLSLLPATVPAAIELAAGHRDLPGTLRSLADLYERQAELRVNAIPAVLTPLMVIAVAVTIGFVVLALILPLVRMLDWLGSG